jgi:hypothetical protein
MEIQHKAFLISAFLCAVLGILGWAFNQDNDQSKPGCKVNTVAQASLCFSAGFVAFVSMCGCVVWIIAAL